MEKTPIDILPCEYRHKTNSYANTCWKTVTHDCDMFESDIIPIHDCVECKVPEFMNAKNPPVKIDTNYLNQLRTHLIQSNMNPDYKVGDRRGIITVGGGKYWPGIYVMIKMLRETGFKDVIQVWYRGKCETVYPEDVLGLNVEFYDVDDMAERFNNWPIPQGNPKQGGWEAKLYALYHTDLREVGFLDADAYYVSDPTPLFNLLNGYGFVFWKDLPKQTKCVKWDQVYPEGKSTPVPPIQGGQLFIDRLQAWKLIHTCYYMCKNSNFYFKHMYGDQDTWRIGLAGGASTYLSLGDAKWSNGVAFDCKHNDITYVLHRCQGKLFAPQDIPAKKIKYSNPRYGLPREAEVFNLLAEVLGKRKQVASKVFGNIYSNALWGGGSGAGSTLKQGQLYIDTINKYIRRHNIKSVVDCGSGDGLIQSKLEVQSYIGLDITESNILMCKSRYKNRDFRLLDFYIQRDEIPSADVLLCKDVLHHWPNEWVEKWLKYLIESKRWKTLLLCQDHKQLSEGQDCHLGGYRAVNYRMNPLKQFDLIKVCDVHHKHLLSKDLK